MRRAETLDAPSLLIDQDRGGIPTDRRAQFPH
jgi:hypothetical protein